MDNQNYKKVLTLCLVIVVIVVVYSILTMQDLRSPTQKAGDAIQALPPDIKTDSQQLEDHTPGQKTGGAVKNSINP